MANNYRRVTAHGHPLAGANCTVYGHQLALHGWGPAPIAPYWCGSVVRWDVKRWSLDRLVPDHLDGNKSNNNPANLVPSCGPCNISRANRKYATVKRRCVTCGIEFSTTGKSAAVNPRWGKFCGRSCRSKHALAQTIATNGGWGRRICADEEVIVLSGKQYRAAHVSCLHCAADIIYAKSGYRPKYCNSQCYGKALTISNSVTAGVKIGL